MHPPHTHTLAHAHHPYIHTHIHLYMPPPHTHSHAHMHTPPIHSPTTHPYTRTCTPINFTTTNIHPNTHSHTHHSFIHPYTYTPINTLAYAHHPYIHPRVGLLVEVQVEVTALLIGHPEGGQHEIGHQLLVTTNACMTRVEVRARV